MTMYHYKLKNNIKNKFICDKCVLNNLKEFMKVVIKINNKLYKQIMKKKYNEEN